MLKLSAQMLTREMQACFLTGFMFKIMARLHQITYDSCVELRQSGIEGVLKTLRGRSGVRFDLQCFRIDAGIELAYRYFFKNDRCDLLKFLCGLDVVQSNL